MTLAARRQISSMANGTVLAPGSTKPAAGATGFVYQHGTTTQVPVFQAETGATTIGQPIVADANGQAPGWLDPGVDCDIVWTYLGSTAPAAELEPVVAGRVVTDAAAAPKTIDSTGVAAGQALVYDTGTGKFLPGAPPSDLTPVTKAVDYTANPSELVLMTGAHAMTLPHTPPSGSRNGLVALTAPCTLVAQAPDTISFGGDSGLSAISVPPGATVKVIFAGGVWYVNDNPVGQTDVLQSGVLAAGDLALSAISINTASGALTFTAAAASAAGSGAWIKRASGLLARIGPAAQTVTPGISLPASTKYAVIGVEIDAAGTISLVKGADTATQLNTGLLIAANSPAVTAGRMRIWDFAIWNNAGVYKFSDNTTVATAGVNMIDRRPWAKGFSDVVKRTSNDTGGSDYTTTSVTLAVIGPLTLAARGEFQGNLVRVRLSGGYTTSLTTSGAQMAATVDGTVADGLGASGMAGGPAIANQAGGGYVFEHVVGPLTGSHLIQIAALISAGTLTLLTRAAYLTTFTVEEIARQNANNGTA